MNPQYAQPPNYGGAAAPQPPQNFQTVPLGPPQALKQPPQQQQQMPHQLQNGNAPPPFMNRAPPHQQQGQQPPRLPPQMGGLANQMQGMSLGAGSQFPPPHPPMATPPLNNSQQMPPPPLQSQQLPPPHQSQQLPPPMQSQQLPPPHQSQQLPPPMQSQQLPPPHQSQQPPPMQSQQLPPPMQSQQLPPPHQSQQLPPPLQQQQHPMATPLHMQQPHVPTPLHSQQPHMPPPLQPQQQQQMPPPLHGQQQQMPPPLHGQQQQMPPPLHGQQQQMPPPQMRPPGPFPPHQQQQQFQPPQGGGYPQMSMGGPPPPGVPGVPGGGMMGGGYPGAPPVYQQQPPKRLDPDQMPNPIQVTHDDQKTRSGVFSTNQKGLVPPLVTTNFVVQDQGNASPRFIRSTMYNVPISQDIMKQTAVPFTIVISPMARTVDQEYPPPVVNFGELGPVRCIRCKAYMCPYMQFIDSGRRFQCLFCKATTDVPQEYFQHLDHTGQRLDRFERPELVLGAYEFVATSDYCRNNTLPKPPAMVFLLDVSYNSVKSGLVHMMCGRMKEIIKNLPVDQALGQEKSNMRVGFITYNTSVHFYNIKGNLAAPQMLIVGDTQEMFMPLLDGFLCTPEESEQVIDALMEQIPAMFGDTRETETVLLPAILGGLEALKASECTGKLLVFHTTLPMAEAPGKLRMRDDRKLLGTDKEKTVLTPQNQAYNQLGQDCVAAGCSVDLFVFNNAYVDLATIGQVARLTGGEVYKYTYFQADTDGDRVVRDVITDISRPIAFDAIMRVRTSTGVRPTDFYGHFFMSNTTDMELAAIDCDKAVTVEIKHDDKLSEEEGVYIQAALLYTSCGGQRRLRVLNLSLKTCSQMADLYRSCDCDTIVNYLAKQAVFRLGEHSPKTVKDGITTRAAQILAAYRKNCASPGSAGQLILPECMKLLPLYVNCLLKSDAISGGPELTIDDRSYNMAAVMIMDVPTSVNYFYPRLIPLVDLAPPSDDDVIEVPASIRCTVEKINEQGVYLLENGIHMFLWIGLGAKPDFIQSVFGVPSAIQVDAERPSLPDLNNPLSLAVRNVIDEVRFQRHRCMRLTLVRPREKLEPVFRHFLVEDRGVTDGSSSYVDFLIHMHKEIRSILS